jgi:23S rRNA (pseudouridine1915-N3)-methyltransferase
MGSLIRVRLLWVGRTRARWVADGVDRYLKLLGPMARVEVVEIKEERGASESGVAVARQRARILKQAAPGFWLLDERGAELRSEEFARRLGASGGAGVDLVVGGAHGVSAEVKAAAGATLALSRMTLTHEMARLLLTEQVYRACTILRGGAYHH